MLMCSEEEGLTRWALVLVSRKRAFRDECVIVGDEYEIGLEDDERK